MLRSGAQMEKQVLSAFKSACLDARWDVAEILFHALEALDLNPQPGPSLSRAYGVIADAASQHPLDPPPNGPSRRSWRKCRRNRRPFDA